MVVIFVVLIGDSISLQSSPIGGVHIARGFKLVLLCVDMLHSTDDGPIGHWAREWYPRHAHSQKQGYMNHVRPPTIILFRMAHAFIIIPNSPFSKCRAGPRMIEN